MLSGGKSESEIGGSRALGRVQNAKWRKGGNLLAGVSLTRDGLVLASPIRASMADGEYIE